MEDRLLSEANIQRLFGNEAAEDEDPKRLSEYYLRSNIYDQIVTDLPLRILVGHKGTGKSALFKIAALEDVEKGNIPIIIQTNDLVEINIDNSNFLMSIKNWSDGLQNIIIKKILVKLGISLRVLSETESVNGKITDLIRKIIRSLKEEDYQNDRLGSIFNAYEKMKIIVYIDDLDRGWSGKNEDITRISSLINAVRDLTNENRDILFRIALRSDVYFLYRTSDESTDKIEGSVVWQTWSNHEIFVLLIKRIETFYNRKIDEDLLLHTSQDKLNRYLSPIMEEHFTGKGLWENAPTYRVLMSLIRKRPRDLVKLCTLAGKDALTNKYEKIGTENFKKIFEQYSLGRIRDTVNEYHSELPLIEELIMNMKPSKQERTTKEGYVYTSTKLLHKIGSIMEQRRFYFSNGKMADTTDLASFLYKINFLTARKTTGTELIRKYFEENNYLLSRFVDFGFDWEIHPAYRWALQPENLESIYSSIQLSGDED